MAESFVFNIGEKVLGKLASLAIEELCLAWGVESELKKLENTISAIQAVLLDAEEKQANNRQLTDWLGKLKDVLYDADDVVDEFQYQVLLRRKQQVCINFFSLVSFRFKMGHDIKEIREKLDEIAAERAKFHLTERVEDERRVVVVHREREREMTHSFVRAEDVFGRQDDKENIVQLLMHPSHDHGQQNVSILPIVGIGGVGKTTLAKLVYNDERLDKHFDLKMWVCVSDDFDVIRLMKETYKSAKGLLDESIISNINKYSVDLTTDQLQTSLRVTLNNKKFLLILDDVWNDDRGKWMELRDLLLGGADGSKVVVTTRSQSVASIMGTIPHYNLYDLPHKDCLSLFVNWAFRKGEEKRYPNLLKIGDEIVKKCGGVPLAVKTLGGLLYSKTDERDWLLVNDNEIWELEQKPNDILPALRLSYDALPAYLKHCFAFYSVFPKDFECYNNALIHLWIAHGLIQSSPNAKEDLEVIGDRYIKELWSRSLLQDAENNGPFLRFKMHDLVHDLALLVAQTEYYTINFDTKTNINNKRDNIFKRVRHVSFIGKDSTLEKFPSFLLEQDKLRTVFFPIKRCRPITSKSFDETSISRFKCMRVLDLRGSCLKELPSSICNLKHLRYLDLSFNRSIKRLPSSICKLQYLQTLLLQGCSNFEELPRDIEKLSSLRCLDITTKQMFFPEISLRVLGIGECHNLKSIGEEIKRLNALRTLTVWQCESLVSLLPSIKYLTELENLTIEGCEKLNLMECNEDIKGLRFSLQRLWLDNLPQLVALPQWLQGAANTLHNIGIKDCPNLRALPEWLQNLTSLQTLVILGCPGLSALPEGMHCLVSLRELEIKACPELRRRCKPGVGEDWPKIAHVLKITLDDDSDMEVLMKNPEITLEDKTDTEVLMKNPEIILEDKTDTEVLMKNPEIILEDKTDTEVLMKNLEITLEDKTDTESRSQPDDITIPRAEHERLQQEIARVKEENMILQN